jgi:AcrR family transcriptional regulator
MSDAITEPEDWPSGYQLKNLNSDGSVPDTRLSSADDARQWALNLVFADRPRSQVRATTKGLIDGFPPYNPATLRAAGRSNAANFNTRKAEYYCNTAVNSYYDTMSEAQYPVTVFTGFGNPDERSQLSQIITEEVARTFQESDTYRYNETMSMYSMVTFGAGPLMFRDNTDWRVFAVDYGDLYVPEMTRSTTSEWEACMIRKTFNVADLYNFIKNPKEAQAIGWDVEATRAALVYAAPRNQSGVNLITWEYFEQRAKNNSMWWAAQSRTVTVDHVFVQEFAKEGEDQGRITHAIIVEGFSQGAGQTLDPGPKKEQGQSRFLFHKVGRFSNWNEVIHPIYYDHGGGGDHHSVTGLAMKMFDLLNYDNRLTCSTLDKAFAPKLVFQATSAESAETMSMAYFGDFMRVPSGVNYLQTPMQGMVNDTMQANNMLDQIIQGNLSTYRTTLSDEQTGNPDTATAIRARVAEQAQVGKTQLDRYFDQKDALYREQVKRLCDFAYAKTTLPGAKDARAFQERCLSRQVPPQALQMISRVFATRITGQGSPAARIQAFTTWLQTGMLQRLPEDGQKQFVDDFAAALFGRMVSGRYTDTDALPGMMTDQQERAWGLVADAHTGINPLPVTPTQNPVVFAQTFLLAATQAIQSVQQGGDLGEVLQFLGILGPAIVQQIQRMAGDPTRRAAYAMLSKQAAQLEAETNKMRSIYASLQQKKAQAQQAQQQAAQAMQGQDPHTVMESAKAKNQMAIDNAKAQQEMAIRGQKHQQEMAIHGQKATVETALKSHANSVNTGLKVAQTSAHIALDKAKQVAMSENVADK